tara:strand:- start:201 stop:524 length:324 start_codon:yes stop_codon:yes gene_type:complete
MGSISLAIKIPYNTIDRLLPTNVVAKKFDLFVVNSESILPVTEPFLLITSICSLSAEIKAISIPEKKAEKRRQTNMPGIREGSSIDVSISYLPVYFFYNRIKKTIQD